MLDIDNKTPVLYYKRSEQKLYVYNAIGKSKITIDPGSFNKNYKYFMTDWPLKIKNAFNDFRETFIKKQANWKVNLNLTNHIWTRHLSNEPSKQNKIVNIRIIFINKLISAILDEIAKKDEETHRDYYDRIYVNTKFEHYLEHYYEFKGATTGRRVRDNQKQLNIIDKYKAYFRGKMRAYDAAITSAADDVVAAVNLDDLNFFNKINKRVVRSITTLNNQYLRKTKKYNREENWMNDYFDGGNTLHKCCIDSIRKFPSNQDKYTFIYRSTNGKYTDGANNWDKKEDIGQNILFTESMNPIERKYQKELAKGTPSASFDFGMTASQRWIEDTKQELYDEEILKVFVHYYVFEKKLLDGDPIGGINRNFWNNVLSGKRERIINSTMDSMKEEYKREKEREFMVLLDNIEDSDEDSDRYYNVFRIQKDDAVDNKLRKLQSDEEKEKTKNLSSVHKFLNQPPINT